MEVLLSQGERSPLDVAHHRWWRLVPDGRVDGTPRSDHFFSEHLLESFDDMSTFTTDAGTLTCGLLIVTSVDTAAIQRTNAALATVLNDER